MIYFLLYIIIEKIKENKVIYPCLIFVLFLFGYGRGIYHLSKKSIRNLRTRAKEWKDEKLNGCGRRVWPYGVYNGEYKNEEANGKGIMTFYNGEVGEGEWKNGRMDGCGKYTWPDEKFYKGEWKDGKMDGCGKYTWPDGVFYEGEWKDNEREGQGKMITDNFEYDGEWYRDVMVNGKIFYKWSNDDTYEGEISVITKGKYTFADGSSYEGEWNIF